MKIIAYFIKEVILEKKDTEIMKNKVAEFRKNFQEIEYCLNTEKEN